MTKFVRNLMMAAASVTLLAGQASAADRMVVLELFTSQGCSSCPPADALLGDLAKRDNVIALAFHVDYWDYLGWKDEFASPENTNRQRTYAAVAQRRSIFTPEMVIQGHDSVVGHAKEKILHYVEKYGAEPVRARISVRRDGTRAVISIERAGQAPMSVVELVGYRRERQVSIKRGENAGRDMTYHNVVAMRQTVGEWDGLGDASFTAEGLSDLSYVVLVQAKGSARGPMIAAAKVE